MLDLAWVKEVKVIDTLLGCQGQKTATKDLNDHLQNGWKLLSICEEASPSEMPTADQQGAYFQSSASFYIIGR